MSQKSANMARRLFAAMPTQSPLPHKEKEKSPHTPQKEKEISPAPVPVPDHRACARACEDSQPLGTGAGSVDFLESGFRSGAGAARRVKIDRDFILFAEYDPVSIALKTLGIPKISTDETSRQYNNARLMRWAIRIIGEDWFRELVYRQWCENRCDGKPNNIAAAFQAKLYAAKSEAQSAANPGGAASSLPESTKGGTR